MSAYNEDFSGGTAGNAPSGWTERWAVTDPVWTVENGGDDKILKCTITTGTQVTLCSRDDVDSDSTRDNVEILTKFLVKAVSAATTNGGVAARGSGSTSAKYGYTCAIYDNDFIVRKYVNNTATTLATVASTLTADTWYWIRFRLNSTSLKARIWADGGSEPGTWSIDTTDSSITAAGWVGALGTSPAGDPEFDAIAIATNGDTASLGSGSQTLTPSLVTNSQNFYAPTIATGAVSLTPSLVTNNQTFFSTTVSRGGVSLQPSLITNTQTFFGSTISIGSITLTSSLVTNGQTFYAPTVGQGDVLRPLLYTNEQTFYAPTVTTSTVDLTPSLVTNTQTFFAPTVANVGGSQSLTPDLFTNGQTFYSATVSTLTLTQADLDAIAAAVWADATAIAAHAKLDTIIARLTC